MKKRHLHLSDLHGYGRLAIDATLGVTDLVEAMHLNFLQLPRPFAKVRGKPRKHVHGPVHAAIRKATGLVYGAVRGVTRMVGTGLDAALGRLQPEVAHIQSSNERAAVLSILNGVLGDHMASKNNPLTITMGWRHQGQDLPLSPAALAQALPHASGRILVMLHGHCMNELQWTTGSGHNHSEVLAQRNGFTPMVLRYNSGLHISQNGRALADQLGQLTMAWPVPVQEICVLGYSMGGLLARSAFYYGALAQHGWMAQVRKLIFVGSPHHGSMLERAGNLVDIALEISPYSEALARLGKIRSAGTTDLRYGNLIDEDWKGRDRFAPGADPRQPIPLPTQVQCYAIAAMIAKEHSDLAAKLVGDGLVPLKSALGQHPDSKHALVFAPERQKVFYGMTHLGLLDSRAVCDQMQAWLAEP